MYRHFFLELQFDKTAMDFGGQLLQIWFPTTVDWVQRAAAWMTQVDGCGGSACERRPNLSAHVMTYCLLLQWPYHRTSGASELHSLFNKSPNMSTNLLSFKHETDGTNHAQGGGCILNAGLCVCAVGR